MEEMDIVICLKKEKKLRKYQKVSWGPEASS